MCTLVWTRRGDCPNAKDNHSQPYVLNEHLCLSGVKLRMNTENMHIYIGWFTCLNFVDHFEVSMSLCMIINLNVSGVVVRCDLKMGTGKRRA